MNSRAQQVADQIWADSASSYPVLFRGRVAADPSLANINRMETLWRQTRRTDIYPGSRVQIAWRVAMGKGSLYPNDGLKRHLYRHITSTAESFADLVLPCYIVATNLDTGAMRVLGERPADRVLDALMATTALPPLHPPYHLLPQLDQKLPALFLQKSPGRRNST